MELRSLIEAANAPLSRMDDNLSKIQDNLEGMLFKLRSTSSPSILLLLSEHSRTRTFRPQANSRLSCQRAIQPPTRAATSSAHSCNLQEERSRGICIWASTDRREP